MEINDFDFGFTPSPYQEKIFDFIIHGNGNAVISAKAGSGKTSTCVTAIKLIKPKNKVMFLAFNKSIAEELSQKLKDYPNVEVRTSHGLGFAIIRKNVEGEVELDEFKYRRYVKSNISELTTIDVTLTKNQLYNYIESICALVDFARFNLAQTAEEVKSLAVKYDVPIFFDECDVVIKVLEWGKTELNSIDYADMVWLPVELSMNARAFQKDFIFIDECQDQSLMSIELFLKCFKRGTRFIAVGDEKQCQPKGTKILMSDGTERNIEDVKIGDNIVTYRRREAYFKGYNTNILYGSKVSNIESHHETEIIKIKTENGLESSYTPSHICYAKINEKNSVGKYLLYLMCNKDGMYRIGTSQFKCGINRTFGASSRMRSEKCEKCWVLDVFDTNAEARKWEAIESYSYGIPQLIFQKSRANSSKFINDENVVEIYNELKKRYSMELKAIELLKRYNKDIRYPFYTSFEKKKISRNHIFECNACNLFPKIMDVAFFDEKNLRERTHGNGRKKNYRRHIDYSNIVNIEHKYGDYEVFSMDVENEHNYVADKILTHNCINTFCGSSEEAFQYMKDYPKTTQFDLPICYRCPRTVVELAKTLVPDIKCREDAPKGDIIEKCWTSSLRSGDMVLCRSKAPLLKVYTKLLRKGIQCHIKGQDIGTNLKKLIEEVDIEELNANLKSDGVFVRLYNNLFEIRNKLMESKGLDYQDATLTNYITNSYDMIKALTVLAENYTTKTELLSHIDEIFDETREGVILSTIHKAKGLEADNVYILCNSSMPSSLAKKEWEKNAEQNLIYVAYTRAKKKLGFISEEEIKPFGISQGEDKILNELSLIENLVCRVLGKTPVEQKECIEIARFNLNNGFTKIENNHKDDNHKIINNATNNNDNELLSELDILLNL